MSRYIISVLLLFIGCTAVAQKPGVSKVRLISSQSASMLNKGGKTILKFYKATFRQDYSELTADSSLHYADENIVDSYGHVVINQGDTLHIFADKLHYDGNTKLATLTGNVKMVDKDATLLTDYFTYNTATKFGTYTGGGKLFNKDNTLTSKNGYYFANTRDAYFRYNVVCTTTDAVIKTDTLRYNAGSRISYFYGPTTITGTKDKDVLYTENGRYETESEQAFFGKKNLYTQGSKTLKGDSLFYDRLKGYGRAVKNVVFDDKEQRATVRGHLGEYFKDSETAIITQSPYVVFVTEDSSKTKDQARNAVKPVSKDSLSSAKKAAPANTADLKPANNRVRTVTPTLKAITDTVMKNAGAVKIPAVSSLNLKSVTDSVIKSAKQTGNIKATTGLPSQMIVTKQNVLKDSVRQQSSAKVDSMYMGADTIVTRVITVKQEREMKLARYLLDNPDTAAARKPKSVLLTKATLPKVLKITPPPFPKDTNFIRPDFFRPPVKTVAKPAAKAAPPKNAAIKPVDAKGAKIDSVSLKAKMMSDTARIRIIMGYHNVKIFKSDLQSKADSTYYSSSDSTIRLFVSPIIWTQGSQLTGDTIALQLKNKKIDNIDLFPNGLIVNIEKNDSLHFNQVAGRRIHGTFKDGRLNTMEVNGNAETIYFNRDTVKNIVTEMARELGNIMKATFKNGKFDRGKTYGNIDMKVNPINKVKDDDKILKGFIWKPQERPKSKEDITGVGRKLKTPANIKPPEGKKPATQAATKPNTKDASPKPAADKSGAPAVNTPPKQTTYDIIISN